MEPKSVTRNYYPDGLRWALMLSLSFAGIMLGYEYLVRRMNPLRFLFGMKGIPKLHAVPT